MSSEPFGQVSNRFKRGAPFLKADPRGFIGGGDHRRIILPHGEADKRSIEHSPAVAAGAASAVPSQNLNPDVLMMEPAEDRYRCDAADLLLPPELRSIFIQ